MTDDFTLPDGDLEISLDDSVVTPARKSGAKSTGVGNTVKEHVFRPLRLSKLAIAVGFFVFLPYFMQRLPDLSSRPEYRLKAEDIQLSPSPEGPIPANIVREVCLRSHLPREISILDSSVCERISAAFAKHPWISKVVAVQKSYPARISVQVEYRQPVAMVQVNGGKVPIDDHGAVLPSDDFESKDVQDYPTIRLVDSVDKKRPFRAEEPGLASAVQLAELLRPRWKSLGFEAIEVSAAQVGSRSKADSQLRLRTKDGSIILWGRSPLTDHPGELTSNQKLARLEKYIAEFGAFDRPTGPYEIDIRHWQEITRRPLRPVEASTGRNGRRKL